MPLYLYVSVLLRDWQSWTNADTRRMEYGRNVHSHNGCVPPLPPAPPPKDSSFEVLPQYR